MAAALVRAGMAMRVAGITRGARMIGSCVRAEVATVVEHRKRGGFVRTGRHVRNGLLMAAVGVQNCQNVSRGAPDLWILAEIWMCETRAPESRRIGENLRESWGKWDDLRETIIMVETHESLCHCRCIIDQLRQRPRHVDAGVEIPSYEEGWGCREQLT